MAAIFSANCAVINLNILTDLNIQTKQRLYNKHLNVCKRRLFAAS